jgi:hypothetical protein
VIRAPYGLGDGIYVRPVIRDQALKRDVWVDTPWPELYEDLGVYFLEPPERAAGLRVQGKQMLRQLPSRWTPPPPLYDTIALHYSAEAFVHGSAYEAMACKVPTVALPLWDLPDMGPSPFDTGDAPLAIVRPCVRRKEWDNPSRNPHPEYISQIAFDLKARGYAVVVICDLSAGEEWLVGDMPPHCLALTEGELSTRQLLAAVQDCSILVGGVGWIVPAAIAAHKPCFVVLGGNGGSNAPEKIIDRRMDGSKIGFAFPKDFCLCRDNMHNCPKDIPDLALQWAQWRTSMRSQGHVL